MGIKVEVWGDYACFTRPEMKVERVSYDVMTPSAARGIIEAVYWHPGFRWKIDRIHVLNPIRFTNIRRNEVRSAISARKMKSAMMGNNTPLYLDASSDIAQRAAMILRDVRYVIEAHFEMTEHATADDNPGKFQDIVKRRLARGQCYHQPCLGCREFPAHFRLFEGTTVKVSEDLEGKEIDLGFMLYDLDYSDHENIQPMFFRGTLVSGSLDLSGVAIVK